MTNEDKAYFENLIKGMTTELTQQLENRIESASEKFQNRVESISENFQNRVESISENFDLKIGLIADGQTILRREMHEIRDELKGDIAHLDFKIDTVNTHLTKKIDAVATDLKAHRADTEAHGGIYRVKES